MGRLRAGLVLGIVVAGLGCGGVVTDLDGDRPGRVVPVPEPEVESPPLSVGPRAQRVEDAKVELLAATDGLDLVVFEGRGEDGPVVVQYSDWRCPHCYRQMDELWPRLQELEVRVRFRNFPLSGPCNPAVEAPQADRCELAAMAFCAHEHGRFEEFVQKARDAGSVERLRSDDDLEPCLESDAIASRVKAQAASGNALGIRGTPTWYVRVDGVWYAPGHPDELVSLVGGG